MMAALAANAKVAHQVRDAPDGFHDHSGRSDEAQDPQLGVVQIHLTGEED
jgi:hypothetical protein